MLKVFQDVVHKYFCMSRTISSSSVGTGHQTGGHFKRDTADRMFHSHGRLLTWWRVCIVCVCVKLTQLSGIHPGVHLSLLGANNYQKSRRWWNPSRHNSKSFYQHHLCCTIVRQLFLKTSALSFSTSCRDFVPLQAIQSLRGGWPLKLDNEAGLNNRRCENEDWFFGDCFTDRS